jgi:hypothetical protein
MVTLIDVEQRDRRMHSDDDLDVGGGARRKRAHHKQARVA